MTLILKNHKIQSLKYLNYLYVPDTILEALGLQKNIHLRNTSKYFIEYLIC